MADIGHEHLHHMAKRLHHTNQKLDAIRAKMNQVASAYFAGRVEALQAIGLLGEFVASAVKAKIRSNIPPKLKQATIDRKGSSIALIDTGRLINSIQSKLVKR